MTVIVVDGAVTTVLRGVMDRSWRVVHGQWGHKDGLAVKQGHDLRRRNQS